MITDGFTIWYGWHAYTWKRSYKFRFVTSLKTSQQYDQERKLSDIERQMFGQAFPLHQVVPCQLVEIKEALWISFDKIVPGSVTTPTGCSPRQRITTNLTLSLLIPRWPSFWDVVPAWNQQWLDVLRGVLDNHEEWQDKVPAGRWRPILTTPQINRCLRPAGLSTIKLVDLFSHKRRHQLTTGFEGCTMANKTPGNTNACLQWRPCQPSWRHTTTEETRGVQPLLGDCWPSVYDAGPAFTQQWISGLCLLGKGSFINATTRSPHLP